MTGPTPDPAPVEENPANRKSMYAKNPDAKDTDAPNADRNIRELNIGLATLNARFVHLAPAPRCLRNAARAAGFANTWVAEFTIRTPAWKIATALLARRPEVLGFSVYIWNREETLALLELIRKQAPEVLLVIGGPEVSFESGPPSPHVDIVIGGEGEEKWVELLRIHSRGGSPDEATLLRWRTHGNSAPDLVTLPYLEEDLEGLAHKLVYLETSRGCPFTCAFCLSALDERVRLYPLDTVKAALRRLIAAGARRIKFLDRTFNLRRQRVHDLFTWLMDDPAREAEGLPEIKDAAFHFEMVGHLLDDETLDLLEQAPPGRFQFEIGVQSTHDGTQTLIARRQDTQRLSYAVRRLLKAERVHLHLDLIWGLPGETLDHIRASFEEILALRPHELQLGFLKFLPGAPIRDRIAPNGYVFQDRPPYEIIAHKDLPAEEVRFLKVFEEVFDVFYNSGRFGFTLSRMFRDDAPWDVFSGLAGYYERQGLLIPEHGLEARTRHLLDWAMGLLQESSLRKSKGSQKSPIRKSELMDLLKLDFCFRQRSRRVPEFLRWGEARATPRVRAWRKDHPESTLVPFSHRITLQGNEAALEPSDDPLWYAFTYPESGRSYFLGTTLECLD